MFPQAQIGRSAASNPYIRVPQIVGDAERLEREIATLKRALEHDGVRVRIVWAEDAVHHILIMARDERFVRVYGRRLVGGFMRSRQ